MTLGQNRQIRHYLFALLCFLSLICIGLILVPIVFQNDTFYTIKIGERIATQGLLPIDDFTFLDGLLYTYPHWLYDYGIYLVYQLGGFKAVYLSSIMLMMILGGLLFFISARISNNQFVTYFIVCATLANLSLNFTARAQMVTYILFIAEYGILYFYAQQKINRIVFFIAMMMISTLIVNIHCAVWLLFFLIGLPFVMEKIVTHYLLKKTYPLSSRIVDIANTQYSALFILITLVISVLAGFLTPLGDTPFTYLIKTYQGVSTSLISEHQPLVPIKNIGFLIFGVQMAYLLFFSRCQFFTRELLLLLGLTLLTILSVRQSAILFLMNALIAPRLLTQAFEESSPKRLMFYTRNIGTVKGIIISLLILLPICYAGTITMANKAKVTTFSETDEGSIYALNYDDHYPVKAMDYFIANEIDPKTARIYADYALGSYVLFRGYHPMVDSRADLYTIEFNHKQDYLKDIIKLTGFNVHYDAFFNQFEINYVLLSKNDPLNTFIQHDGLYPTIYEDNEFVLYHILRS